MTARWYKTPLEIANGSILNDPRRGGILAGAEDQGGGAVAGRGARPALRIRPAPQLLRVQLTHRRFGPRAPFAGPC